ncbi:hypothetical protein GQ457_05G014730 [Hibiscus cannabinus]
MLVAVRYIRASPSRIKKFYKCAEEEMIETKAHLCLDVPTRWNSTYMMLKVAAKYEHAFDSYARDDQSFFLDLSTGDGVPTFDDWENVRIIEKVLEPFYDLTLKVSGSLHATSHFWEVLIEIHCLLDEWACSEDLDVISITSKMREKYNKYLGDAKKINFSVYLANIFDPRHKMEFVNFGVKLLFPDIFADVMKTIDKELHCFFYDYSSISGRAMVYEGQSSIPTKVSNSAKLNPSKTSLDMQQYLLKKQRVGLENKSELDRYLAEKEEVNNLSSFDILLGWKMNSPRYPVLAQMARDVLSIPISTVTSESAFSTSGRVLDGFRSSLTPIMVEALICTQDWLRKSKDPINLDEYAAELQNMEDVNELKGFGEAILEDKLVRKLIYSLPESWDSKKTTIIEAKNLKELKLDELIGSLLTHELMSNPLIRENDKKIKEQGINVNAIALKSSKCHH